MSKIISESDVEKKLTGLTESDWDSGAHFHLGNPGRLLRGSGIHDDPALHERARPMKIRGQSSPGRGNSQCSILAGEGASG